MKKKLHHPMWITCSSEATFILLHAHLSSAPITMLENGQG